MQTQPPPPTPTPTQPRVLIVDDDVWIRKMVATMLERHGYAIDSAANGEEALARIDLNRPDLIITDVTMPRMDGWSLIRALRTRQETALTPVIFLTALGTDDDRIRGFRLGADDYLPKPFRFEELDLRVQKTLRHSSRLRETAREAAQPGLRGSLDQIGLSVVLVMLEGEKKSGLLLLQRGDDVARLFLRQGRVLQAHFDGREKPRDADCIYEALQWVDGSFDFSTMDVQMEDRIDTSTTHLLIEGALRIDHGRRL